MKPAQYIRTCTLMLTDNFYYFCNKCQISFQGAGKKIPCLFSPFASHALIPGEKRQEEGGGREGGKAQNKGKGEEKSAHCTLVAQEERHGVLRERKRDAAAAKGDFTFIWSGEKGGKEEVSALFCVRGSFFVEEVLLEQGTGKTFLLKKSSA